MLPVPRRGRSRHAIGALSAALLAGALTVPLAASGRAAAAPGDVVFAEDFDDVADGALPAGWTPVTGTWAVQGGRLVGQTASIGRITFGPHLENYRLEATVRFEQVNNTGRWLAPILDIAPNGSVPWWQAAMRAGTTAANGIELAERTAANAWSVPYTASAPYAAGTGRDVPIAIEVQGAKATWIFDGQEVLEGRINRTANGILGFSYDGATISIDDIVVTEIEPDTPVIDDGELPVTIAHRGYSSVAPENSLAAYASAMRTGAEFVEIDVHTTADGVPIVLHDQTVDRTTDGTGDVARLQSSYFTGLEAGSWFSPAFRWQPAPTFQDMLDLMVTGPSMMLLEIKGPETRDEVNRVVDMIVDAGLSDRVVIQSFDTNVLQYAKQRAPHIPTGLLRGSLDPDPVATAQSLGADFYNPNATALLTRPGVVADLNAAGIAVYPYTVNSANDWRLLTDIGVDGIITDRAGAFIGWKQAQAQIEEPPPAPEPTVSVVVPAEGTLVDRGGSVAIAASALEASAVTLTVDGQPVENGAVLAAADLGLGEHTVVARATGAGGEAQAERTFTVIVTVEGLRGRLLPLPMPPGHKQQLQEALEAQRWDDVIRLIERHVEDATLRAELVADVRFLADG